MSNHQAPARRSYATTTGETGAAAARINASVVYPDNVAGMWSYSTTEWNPTRLATGILATGGGFAAKGYYYITRYIEAMGLEEIKTINYNLSDWSEYDSYTGYIQYVATTMAYNPLRDEVYGCFINPERTGYNFVEWNYSYFGIKRTICPIVRPWSGCAFSSDGTLYAIERNGDLYTVDIKTGEMTLVGSTGVKSDYIGDATIDPATDTMYWSVTTDTDFGLYTVDLKTAKATKAYELLNEEQLCGMYVPEPEVERSPDAPAKISSSPSANFSGSSLTGTIIFYTPTYTIGQERLDAETDLTYTVRANGDVIATGTCTPGNKRTSVSVTLTEPDNYYFTVTTSNDAGESEPNGTKKFVGPDTPKPSTVTATVQGTTVNLSWTSPSSSGVNGGNVAYSTATYRVVRYPDGKVIADAETARKATDVIEMPAVRTAYTYGVVSTVDGLSSAEAKSAEIVLGPIVPPYEGTFTAATSLAGWTILNVNTDDYTWKYSSSSKALEAYGSKGFDDWAITPAVKVRDGSSYPFAITLKTSNYYEETFEVKWGTAPTVEAMTNTLIEPTAVKSSTAQTFQGEIMAEETAEIYIGIHAATAEKSSTIDVISFTIGDGTNANAPAAVTDFAVATPVDGTRKADITFTAPSKTVKGEDLTGDNACTAIVVTRDGTVIATLTENIGPGANVALTDNAETLTLGKHLYAVVASNAHGDSPAAECEALVGARKPVAPESAKMIEDGNTGKVTISWTPVTTDVEGNSFNADAVSYRVINREYETVADNVKGTSVTLTAVEEGEQAFCQFGVYAVTAGGESDKMAATDYKPVGAAYPTPWAESFKDKTVSTIFGYNYISGREPWRFVSQHDWGFGPQDNDGGFTYLEAYSGDITALVTGKINLEGLSNPAFTYYTYNYQNSLANPTNKLSVQVDKGDGNGFVIVQTDRVCETGEANTWNKVIVPLTDFEGQSVIFRIMPSDTELAVYTLDNLRVNSYVEYNLTASNISAPAAADVDKPFEITATVSNTGDNTIRSFTVELWRNDEPVDHVDCTALEPSQLKEVTFEQTLDVTAGEYVSYKAVVVCDNDLNDADNTSEEISVGLVAPTVPAVNDLTATSGADGAVLSWSAPDVANAPGEPFTETFDNAEAWSNVVAGWKFVDADGLPVGGTNVPEFPCTGLQSWFVVNNTLSGIQSGTDPTRWNAHSGNQFICSEYVSRGGVSYQSDDWAVTPLLNTVAQAFSFYAKSFDPKYPETFEVLASASTTSPDDFTSIGKVIDAPNAWMQYRFKLPEGTKYAAIRSRSTDKYFLFIDDVTFIPADAAPAAVTLKGYNIYRNGMKLNSTLLTEPAYTDATTREGRKYSYFVTAVYDRGESRPSNTADIDLSGVASLYGDSGVDIRAIGGGIVVKGLTQGKVAVIATNGRTVASAEAAPTVRISLQPGIYVVNAAGHIAKVIVR